GAADGGEIDEAVAVAVSEVFQKASYFWLSDGGFYIVDEAGERKNLALADELLRQVGLKKLDFLGQGAGQFGLLNALGIDEFFLAELQDLAVIEADGKG